VIVRALKRLVKAGLSAIGYRLVSERCAGSGTVRHRAEYGWVHAMPDRLPMVDVAVIAPRGGGGEAMAVRLLKAFGKAVKDEAGKTGGPRQGDFWAVWSETFLGELAAVLKRDNPAALAEHMDTIFQKSATHGLGRGADAFRNAMKSSRLHASFYMDKLAVLGVAVGALPMENPEQGRWGENLFSNPDDLVAGIERAVGFSVRPPAVCGNFGVRVGEGIFHPTDIGNIYVAWKSREMLRSRENPAVCEIGAGHGGLAYFARRPGLRRYAIVDLPVVNVIQGYYLLSALPLEDVRLYGEGELDLADGVGVFPYWCFREFGDRSVDLVINQDSFPVISRGVVLDYLAAMRRNTSGYFMSINQESRGSAMRAGAVQQVVPELVAECGGFHRIARTQYWIRRGYVEEIYAVGGAPEAGQNPC